MYAPGVERDTVNVIVEWTVTVPGMYRHTNTFDFKPWASERVVRRKNPGDGSNAQEIRRACEPTSATGLWNFKFSTAATAQSCRSSPAVSTWPVIRYGPRASENEKRTTQFKHWISSACIPSLPVVHTEPPATSDAFAVRT